MQPPMHSHESVVSVNWSARPWTAQLPMQRSSTGAMAPAATAAMHAGWHATLSVDESAEHAPAHRA